MYKIYINDRPLILCDSAEVGQFTPSPRLLAAPYSGKFKTLYAYIDTLEKGSPKIDGFIIYSNDMPRLWQDFCGIYRQVPAAGGLVRNAQSEWLFIFRRGSWDLPKGKIDEGETPEQAALREVGEETGLQQLQLEGFAGMTYHTYRDRKNERCLKPTYWYAMTTPETALTPQQEEDIEEATWMSRAVFEAMPRPFYPSLADLLAQFWDSNPGL